MIGSSSTTYAPDAHAVALKAKLPRQPHRLAAAVLEELGMSVFGMAEGSNPRLKYISNVYTKQGRNRLRG